MKRNDEINNTNNKKSSLIKTIVFALIFIIFVVVFGLGYYGYTEYTKNKSLEEHFGNVELSDEEIEQIAKDSVLGDKADDIDSFNKTEDNLDTLKLNLYSTKDIMKQTVDSYTGSLSDKKSSEYIEISNNFVSLLKEYLEQNNISFNKSIDMLFNGDADGEEIKKDTNTIYQEELSITDLYGNSLIETIKTSLTDNIISTTEQESIKNNLQKLINIVDSHQKAEIEAEKDISNE